MAPSEVLSGTDGARRRRMRVSDVPSLLRSGARSRRKPWRLFHSSRAGEGKGRGGTGRRQWWRRNDFRTGEGRVREEGSFPLVPQLTDEGNALSPSLSCT